MPKGRSRQQKTASTRSTAFPSFTSLTSSDLLLLTLPAEKRKPSLYHETDNILLIGEGDFTFCLALTAHLGENARITATSLDTLKEVHQKYPLSRSTLTKLKKLDGVQIKHGFDCTKIDPSDFSELFDRIVFMFPHVGGGGSATDKAAIKPNCDLLSSFFSACRPILSSDGQIHITLRDTPFYNAWNIEQLATKRGFKLKQKAPFEGERFLAMGYSPQRTHPAVREAPSVDNAFTYCFTLGEEMDVSSSESESVAAASEPEEPPPKPTFTRRIRKKEVVDAPVERLPGRRGREAGQQGRGGLQSPSNARAPGELSPKPTFTRRVRKNEVVDAPVERLPGRRGWAAGLRGRGGAQSPSSARGPGRDAAKGPAKRTAGPNFKNRSSQSKPGKRRGK